MGNCTVCKTQSPPGSSFRAHFEHDTWHVLSEVCIKSKYTGQVVTYNTTGSVRYKGSVVNGQAHGHGETYRLTGELRYRGQCEKNNANGHGELYDTNGKLKYRGNFVDGKFNGYGEEYYPTGELKYRGHFVDGKYHGHGELYYYPTGELMYKGEFVNGKFQHGKYFIYDDRHVITTYTYNNGTITQEIDHAYVLSLEDKLNIMNEQLIELTNIVEKLTGGI